MPIVKEITFVNDVFKKELLESISQFCRDCSAAGIKVGPVESRYIDSLHQLIADPHQTNEGLIDALMTYLPQMQVDVMFCGFRVYKRKSKLVGYIASVLKQYPLSVLNAMDVVRFRELFKYIGGSEAAGLEKAELIRRLGWKHKELADTQACIDELKGEKAGVERELGERVREAGLRITALMQDNLRLRQETSTLELRVQSQREEIDVWKKKVASLKKTLKESLPRSRGASVNGDESTPLMSVFGH